MKLTCRNCLTSSSKTCHCCVVNHCSWTRFDSSYLSLPLHLLSCAPHWPVQRTRYRWGSSSLEQKKTRRLPVVGNANSVCEVWLRDTTNVQANLVQVSHRGDVSTNSVGGTEQSQSNGSGREEFHLESKCRDYGLFAGHRGWVTLQVGLSQGRARILLGWKVG